MFGTYQTSPNWGKEIGENLSSGLTSIANHKLQEISQQKQRDTQRQEQSRISQQLQQGGIPKQDADILSSAPPKERYELLQQLAQGYGQVQQGNQQEFTDPQDLLRQQLGEANAPAQYQQPQAKPTFAQNLGRGASKGSKVAAEAVKQQQSKKHVQKAYNRVKDILDTGYTGYSLKGWTPEGRKQRSELDTLSEVFISSLIPLLNPKGTMSKERFNYIKDLVPNSWDTDATIKGKLSALKDIFQLQDRTGADGNTPGKKEPGKTVEMKDADGATYDIPRDRVAAAKKAGLR